MTQEIAATPEVSLAAAMAQFDASRLAHQTLSTTAMAQNKETLFAAMRTAGITEIIVTFDGAGDSGQIEDIDARRGDAVVPMPDTEIILAQVSWGISEISTSSMSLSEAVEALAYEVLSPSRHLPIVEFGRSADGLLVARVGDTAFAMVPTRQGRHSLATGWRLSRPLETWRRGDVYGQSGDVADEVAFRALVAENAEHQRECAALRRREVGSRANTPWGPSQGATIYGDGVLCHSTAGHGGFQLGPEQNARVPPLLRSASGFYEEDAEWAAVAQALPELFTGYERRLAGETQRNHWPDAWEAIHGRALQPGESRERDRQTFERQHVGNWIVISAVSSDRFRCFVETTATPGGQRGPGVERRRFLVPSAEYDPGLFGFVVDPMRHRTPDEDDPGD